MNILQNIFSITNKKGKNHKIFKTITVLGIEFKFKAKYKTLLNLVDFQNKQLKEQKKEFADEIMSKKTFSKSEIIEFLNFVSFIEKDLKKNGINASFITEAYFAYMLSKVKQRAFLLKNKIFYQTFFKLYSDSIVNCIIKNIFSVTNEYNLGIRTKENKQKFLRVFGLKIKLK